MKERLANKSWMVGNEVEEKWMMGRRKSGGRNG